MMLHPAIPAILILASVLFSAASQAAILPYSERTRDFSSWTPATRGDINTIGMGGATLALPTSISAAEENPAGFAMMTGSVSAQINKISLSDDRLQRTGEPIESSQWGLGVSPDHWGFSIAYYSPQTESGVYVSPNTGDTVKTEVSLKELRFTIAHSFFDDALAIGVSPEITKAVRELDGASSDNYGLSYKLGLLYRLRDHLILGASFSPRISVGPSQTPDPETVMPGFNRNVVKPLQTGFGLGWMPNRFFKAGASLTYVGATDNTSLLSDQSVETGANHTVVPRLGASYVVAEFNNLKVEAAGGAYYEESRLSNAGGRAHVTGGIEANPYFINVGAGFDVSNEYRTLIVSIGIDIVRTARSFDIIPKDNVPAYGALWPPIAKISADGLPSGLTRGETHQYAAASVGDVGKIVQAVPQNVANRVNGLPTTVQVQEKKEHKEDVKEAKLNKRGKRSARQKKRGEPIPPSPTPAPSAGGSLFTAPGSN